MCGKTFPSRALGQVRRDQEQALPVCGAHQLGDHDSSPFVSCGSLAPSPPASLLVRAQLPMWPSIRRLWPSSRRLAHGVWMLGRRGFALESLAARICREAGGRVRTNMFLRDMDLPLPVGDARRFQIVVDGLPLRGGAQLAVDTTFGVCSARGREAQTKRSGARWGGDRSCPGVVEKKDNSRPRSSLI